MKENLKIAILGATSHIAISMQFCKIFYLFLLSPRRALQTVSKLDMGFCGFQQTKLGSV